MQKLHEPQEQEPDDVPDWKDEEGSDALMELRAKIRLWIERAREG